jgi:hypothetical protein
MIDLSELDQDIQIPDPIAPPRPVPSLGESGSVPAPQGDLIPFTNANGVSGVLDSQGNMWNSGGQYIGQLTGTPAPTTPAPGPAATVSSPSSPAAAASSSGSGTSSGAIGTLAKWAAGLVTGTSSGSGFTLEDFVLIVLGLLLIAAAIFGFKGTQEAIQNVSRGATKAAETAAAA